MIEGFTHTMGAIAAISIAVPVMFGILVLIGWFLDRRR